MVCSHGDVIKSVIADALGLHLDSFQRISVDPCSISVISYTPTRPFVSGSTTPAVDLSSLVPKPDEEKPRGTAGEGAATRAPTRWSAGPPA